MTGVRRRNGFQLLVVCASTTAGVGCSRCGAVDDNPAPRPAHASASVTTVLGTAKPDGDPSARALRRFGSSRLRHSSDTTCVAFSPDGKVLAAGDDGGSLVLWDAATGERKAAHVLPGPSSRVWTVAYAPDGKYIAMGDQDGFVHLLDASTTRILAKHKTHNNSVNHVSFSPSGEWIAAVGYDPFVAFWSTKRDEKKVLTRQDHPETLEAEFATWAPDGSYLWVGGEAGAALMRKHENPVLGMVPAAVRIEFPSGVEREQLGGARRTSALVMAPQSHHMAVATIAGSVDIRDSRSGQRVGGIPIGAPVYAVAFSPDGKRIAVTAQNKGVSLFDTQSGRLLCAAPDAGKEPLDVVFSPDGQRFATAGRRSVLVMNADTCAPAFKSDDAHAHPVCAAAISPDGRMVASGDTSGQVLVWNPAAGSLIRSLPPHRRAVISVVFSLDGESLATAGEEGSVVVWRTKKWIRYQSLMVGRQVNVVAFSPDAATLATGRYHDTATTDIVVWDLRQGYQRVVLDTDGDPRTEGIAFTDGGKTLVALTGNASKNRVQRWDLQSGARKGSVNVRLSAELVVSPRGDFAVAGPDGTVSVYDASDKLVRELPGPRGWIDGLALASNDTIAAARRDGFLYLWRLRDGALLAKRFAHPGGITAVAFGDKTIVTAGSDGTATVWAIDKL